MVQGRSPQDQEAVTASPSSRTLIKVERHCSTRQNEAMQPITIQYILVTAGNKAIATEQGINPQITSNFLSFTASSSYSKTFTPPIKIHNR